MMPFFKYYRFFKTGRGNVIGRPVNPYSLYPIWPGFKALNEPYCEFEQWAEKMTLYVTDGIKPGVYDKADIKELEWLIESEDDYHSDSEIPIERLRTEFGDEYFLLYCLKEPSQQMKIVQVNDN